MLSGLARRTARKSRKHHYFTVGDADVAEVGGGDAAVLAVHLPLGGVADLVDLGRDDLVVLRRRAAVVVVAVRDSRAVSAGAGLGV